MARLLTHTKASSRICETLQAFGHKSFPRDEGYSHCDVAVKRDRDGTLNTIGSIEASPLSQASRRRPAH